MYQHMLLARCLDDKLVRLARQGRSYVYTPSRGHEAVHAAVASAITADDWLLPTFRDTGALIGDIALDDLLLHWMGLEDGHARFGRRLPIAASVGGHLPQGVGLAWAEKLTGTGAAAVCLFGDGATSTGDFHEALNLAAVFAAPTVFVCQNNGMALSTPVSRQTRCRSFAAKGAGYGIPGLAVDGTNPIAVYRALQRGLKRARAGRGPTLIEARLRRLGAHSTASANVAGGEDAERDPVVAVRRHLESIGLWDADREQQEVERSLLAVAQAVDKAEQRAEAAARDGAPILRNGTLKGGPKWPSQRPRPGAVNRVAQPTCQSRIADDNIRRSADERAPRRRAADDSDVTMIEAINRGLTQAMEHDERVIVLGEDVGHLGGVFGATRGLLQRFGERRVIDTPISESGIVGAAAGLAMAGLRPVCEVQFAGFLLPALDQIYSQVSRIRARTAGALHANVVIRAPFGAGVGAPEFHSDAVDRLLTAIPGLAVWMPEGPQSAHAMMLAAVQRNHPVVILEHMALYRGARGPLPPDRDAVFIPTERVMAGDNATVVACGALAGAAERAAAAVRGDGITADVFVLRSLAPLDSAPIAASLRKTRRLVVAHEGPSGNGLAAELLAKLAETHPAAPVDAFVRVTGPHTVRPFPAREHLWTPSQAKIAAALRQVCAAGHADAWNHADGGR